MTVSAREVQDAVDAVKQARDVLNARMETLLEVVARVPLPETPAKFVCPVPSCGIGKASQAALADHLANVHGIDEPTP